MLMDFYPSYEDMITAMHSTSGKEYDIKEMYTPEPDTVYRKMMTVLKKEGIVNQDGQVREGSRYCRRMINIKLRIC